MSDEVLVTKKTFIRRTLAVRNILILLIISCFVLTILARQYKYFGFDLQVSLFVQGFNLPWFDFLMKFTTMLGDEEVIIPTLFAVCFFWLILKKNITSFMIFASAAGSAVLSEVLKFIVARPRPDPALIHQIGQYIKSDSFPSGHVLGILGFYGFLLYLAYTQLKKGPFQKVLITIFSYPVLLIGLSRIYLGAHWFSDVLGAYLIGFIWLYIVVYFYRIFNK